MLPIGCQGVPDEIEEGVAEPTAMAEQMSDRRLVRVEVEVSRQMFVR